MQIQDPTSILKHGHDKNYTYLWDFLEQFSDLEETLGPDFDLVVLSETKSANTKMK